MGLFISVGLVLLFLLGCSATTPEASNSKNSVSTAAKELQEYKQRLKNGTIPPMLLPSAYKEVSVLDEKKITFSAQDANFKKVLYAIATISNLNLAMDEDIGTDNLMTKTTVSDSDKNRTTNTTTNTPIVNSAKTITMSVTDVSLRDALDIVMNISGCFYEVKGNILHVKQFEQKSFNVPYVRTTVSNSSELGGDMLSSTKGTSASSGVKGEFKLKHDNPAAANNFYEQLEANLASLISSAGKYTLNRFSGILNVRDKKTNMIAIESMLEKIKKESGRQVIVEAKILEVILNDSHSLGVSWDAVANSVLRSGDQLQITQALGLSGAVAGTMQYSSKNFSSIINALSESGTVDTLSNPKISVLSGQSAMISSGKLIPFWEKEVQTTYSTSGTTQAATYTRRDVLNGVTMGVTPTVMENGKIMLNIIPITSSIEETHTYSDNGAVVASAPVLNIKEAGTIISTKDNDLILIGGLINNTTTKNDSKVPLLGDLPWVGGLFRGTSRSEEKRELVILLRLKIVE